MQARLEETSKLLKRHESKLTNRELPNWRMRLGKRCRTVSLRNCTRGESSTREIEEVPKTFLPLAVHKLGL